ncbi:MAG TPA: cytochrome ubiquinol oxidase subunit I [Solirubrobacteraceae bacterium]|jgi:cytochrome d ubiquinol oxidase subunit I|nr:cytochrome ubiquinol oxidase subunit I [Solirubrobacteraceae bacterium]
MWLLASAQQTYLDQAAQMQALSFTVHIPLVCFGIALPSMIVFVEWLHLRSGEEVYRTIARRWTRIMAALFAVGVITGTILSFEMGMLWPGFMSTFGGVFGLGFAIEGFSFFLEAIFIGIYVYGWERLSPRAHLLSGIPIVIAGFTGSLMVISVNAWMQHPSGFKLAHGRVVDVHPLAALFGNSFLWNELIHMYLAAYIVTGFLLATPYAIGRLRGRFGRYERTACAIPLTIAAVVSPIQILIGDWAARDVATEQPTKLAAMEGLAKTTHGASEHLLGWYVNGQIKFGIGIPDLLSILAFHNPNAKVQGLDTVPISQRPPVNIERVSFQLMVALGTGFAALGLFFLFLRWRQRIMPTQLWFYLLVAAAGPASVVALIAGWFVTEIGRQPWTVYRVMTTAEAVTRARGVPVGYGALAATYLLVACGVVWVLRRLARAPLNGLGETLPGESEVGAQPTGA